MNSESPGPTKPYAETELDHRLPQTHYAMNNNNHLKNPAIFSRFLSIFPDAKHSSTMSGAWEDNSTDSDRQSDPDHQHSHINFDFFSATIVKPKDYYKILEVDYDATDDDIRSNYIRLALKWHPDKQKDHGGATSRFQDINEAYQVLSDPSRRQEYDEKGMLYVNDDNIVDYLKRYKGLILTCNGLETWT